MPRLERLAVALDTADWERFDAWCALFGPRVGYLKVGLEAYVRFGPRAVERARESGARVFLDLKLHDIPNTVAGAVGAARELGVSLLTLHAGGGRAMLAAAVEAARGELGLLAVTVLTHLDPEALAELALPGAIGDRALAWARLAQAAGCRGIVCSAQELGVLRPALPPPFLLVTPGIRPPAAAAGDQRRVATPETALAAGSDLLVVGRPLTAAPDPDAALAAFAAAR
ncbi:MAG TPA: orotidine-5'-phosphate decarboxylase [Thermoanaerobaculia bacterium]|jgi:orotidine-5'-phosphate decarboxylase|nr:orotidine-5'-phosphate decarboxylase [Thermoanaerobaculia bacterium]MDI9631156.1 orotidine-5'-phosphate decarboxylase [Acidobacteriota bacterium]MBP7812407.1 orotidine-5'-phosphate decarboxylase [Thermoanaerobaculia bacterium]HNU82235.1 orotidine-5'-phosphate decarboxylase [Thermoanaerobaculia bacterium]HNZ95632.1 orotidine-5'-phosphate decarboxylase [Thermoanaerobaculia bacterium]